MNERPTGQFLVERLCPIMHELGMTYLGPPIPNTVWVYLDEIIIVGDCGGNGYALTDESANDPANLNGREPHLVGTGVCEHMGRLIE